MKPASAVTLLITTLTLALAMASQAYAQPLTGAIFTTDANGTVVNGNIYESCCDVYLNGGPPPNAPCTSAGLPNGEYYFQVTDPSGAVLLSSDDISQRRFRVQDGLIVEYFGVSGDCQHETGLGKCHAANPSNISVQLMPFAPTPNPGGVYKAWVTRVSDYDPAAPQAKHGFKPNKSKTDNFKCEQQMAPPSDDECVIIVKKYNDIDGDGRNDGEPPLDGVAIEIWYTPPGGTEVFVPLITGSAGPGCVTINVPVGSLVTICEKIGSGEDCEWQQTEPNASSPNAIFHLGIAWCYQFICPPDDAEIILNFGNVCISDSTGGKAPEYFASATGKVELQIEDPAWRTALNQLTLRQTDGKRLTVAAASSGQFKKAHDQLKKWLKSSSNGNVAAELSKELASLTLRVASGKLDGQTVVILPAEVAETIGLEAGGVEVNTLAAMSNATIKDKGVTVQPSPARTYQSALRDVLRDVNSNSLPVISIAPPIVTYAPD